MKRGLRSKVYPYDDVMNEESFDEIIESIKKGEYSETKEILKEKFNINLINKDGTYKTLLEALAEIWDRLS